MSIMSFQEKRHKFYDDLIDKFLDLKELKDLVVDEDGDTREAIANLFRDSGEDEFRAIFGKIPEFWMKIQSELREQFQYETSDIQTFYRDGIDFKAVDAYTNALDTIESELKSAWNRKVANIFRCLDLRK